jgi:hypothetical protein
MAKRARHVGSSIKETLHHFIDTMQGRTPKKALRIDGPMRSKQLMVDGLKYLNRLGPTRSFVRTNGTWFEGRANVRDYPNAIKWRRKHRPLGGHCFQNAREFCIGSPDARYYEGFYLILETPEEHAWVVMPDGRVLDFTLEAVNRDLIKQKKEVHIRPPLYLGVEVPHIQLKELHDRVEENYPILDLFRKIRKQSK